MSFGKKLKDQLIAAGVATPDYFAGCSEGRIAKIMETQGVTFLPQLFREVLLEIGAKDGGMFAGEDWGCDALLWVRKIALELIADFKIELPEDAFVFFMHQGCIFWYFRTKDQEEDPAVYVFNDTPEIEFVCQHLSEFFNDAVSYIVEKYGKKP